MDYIVRKIVKINADPRRVWNALTDPELTKRYFFGCKVSSTWKPGGDIIFKGRSFLIFKYELKGKILKIEPGRKLVYSIINTDNSTSTVTDVLSYLDGVTTLEITDNVGQGAGAEERFKKSEKGWGKVLKGLKKVVEER